jgi:putative iron-dependent peroxidase
VPIEPQSVDAPLSRAAVFLVVTIVPGDEALARTRSVIADIGALVQAVGFRDLNGHLSCNVGIGSDAWNRLGQKTRPAQLHPFAEVRGPAHTAEATPGDLLFHIRAERGDLCFELERLLLNALDDAVTVVDEVQGFRYFDARDLLGFVDGTENPTGNALYEAALIGEEDAAFAGGAYVVVQKYLDNLTAWGELSVEEQERIVGRTKLDDVERDDAGEPGGRKSHRSLNTIVDVDGTERDILRDNMPFGRPGHGDYFIGYAGDLSVIERMIHNMFVGDPPGDYDRILDYSTAVTGTAFFVPSHDLLDSLGA